MLPRVASKVLLSSAVLTLGVAPAVAPGCDPPEEPPPTTTAPPTTSPPVTTTAPPTTMPAHGGHGCEWPTATPSGALPPAKPMFCDPLRDAASTFVRGSNSWLDEFNGVGPMATIGAGYRVFDDMLNINQSAHFRHNDHWMVDVNGHNRDRTGQASDEGGAMLRPDRSFRFVNGKLVVEVDVAAGIAEYGGHAWPEIIVTTAPAPTDVFVRDGHSYGVGQFGGYDTVGIRLHSLRNPIESMFNADTTRRHELSSFQFEGSTPFGGGPYDANDQTWRVCAGSDPDTNCRDRFRWELTADTITLYVNGVKYMEHAGLPVDKQLPGSLINSNVYVYFASWMVPVDTAEPDTTRFHWDRIAVNP